MKKIAIILFLFSAVANAQFSYGPKVGFVVANIEVSPDIPIVPENKISYSYGVFSEFKFSKKSLCLDISYGEYGSKGITAKNNNNPNTGNPNIDVKVNMLVFDLTGNYYFTDNISTGAGVYYGAINSVSHDISDYGNINMTNKYELNDMGLIFKGKWNLHKRFFVEAKYNFGLANIIKPNNIGNYIPNINIDDRIKNRFLIFSIGYIFM